MHRTVFGLVALVGAELVGVATLLGIMLRRARPVATAGQPIGVAPSPAAIPPRAAPARPPIAEEDQIEDGRPVAITAATLVWGRIDQPLERYAIQIDTVSRDCMVFGGQARRLDQIQVVPSRRLFHTIALAQERLLAAHDGADRPIENVRAWLLSLPDA